MQEKKRENILQFSIVQKYIETMDEKAKMKFWIKTLLSSYNIFPQIIKTIDKIIELQASSLSFYSDVFNLSKTAYKEYEKVIDLTERKDSLINIYIMTKKLLNDITDIEYEILERKYIDGWCSEEIASEFGISRRTVFRKLDKILEEIYHNCKQNKWTVRFIESQTKGESWLKDKFNKLVLENFKNSNYKSVKKYISDYSKSSSELYVGNLG